MSIVVAQGAEPASGDAELSRLYALHATEARRFAYLLCGDEESAADVVQEAFERVARRLFALRDAAAFPRYLRRTIRNLLAERARSAHREEARLQRYASRVDEHDAVIASDGALWEAMQRLPERQRAALVCRYWLDLSTTETARVLSCRPGTVKSLVSRAVAELRATGGLSD